MVNAATSKRMTVSKVVTFVVDAKVIMCKIVKEKILASLTFEKQRSFPEKENAVHYFLNETFYAFRCNPERSAASPMEFLATGRNLTSHDYRHHMRQLTGLLKSKEPSI